MQSYTACIRLGLRSMRRPFWTWGLKLTTPGTATLGSRTIWTMNMAGVTCTPPALCCMQMERRPLHLYMLACGAPLPKMDIEVMSST